MKLRLRSFESKQTLKIEVPNPCSLHQLKQILAQTLSNSPSPSSIRLSLNRKDDLPSTGDDSLQSIGVTAGDLIYFSILHPPPPISPISQNTLPHVTTACSTSLNTENTLPLVSAPCSTRLNTENALPQVTAACSTSLNTQNALPQVTGEFSTSLNTENTLPQVTGEFSTSMNTENILPQKGEILARVSEMENDEEENVLEMEVDDEDNDEISFKTDVVFNEEVVDKSLSVPGFFRKVFVEELGDDTGRHHKLIVTAIHAVMMETGFVGFDKNANVAVNGFHLRNEWPSCLFMLSLFYTLQGEGTKSVVVLKFQSLGKFINVYGTLENGSGKRGTYRVQLNEEQLVPLLNVVWANCGVNDGGLMDTSMEKEVFEFWRNVKDNLALPLLIDLCEESGLELPPCFMRLPTDVKLKILESLPGVEIAKTCCVCSELRYLGSSDELWEMKYKDELGDETKEVNKSWKKSFAKEVWDKRNKRKLSRARVELFWGAPFWAQPRRRRNPNPFMVPRVPRIIGGDYDIEPPFGDDLQNGVHDVVNRPMRIFSPPCNLGVRGGRIV